MSAVEPDPELIRAAFREVHGPRLYGFGLLILHGDRPAAADLAARVLHAHAPRAASEAHPERAAAQLRADLLRRTGRLRRPPLAVEERETALAALGIGRRTAAAIGRLEVRARAALVAADVERFGAEDVATILGRPAGRVRRDVDAARQAYRAAFRQLELIETDADDAPMGPVSARIARVAARALGTIPDEIGA